MKQRIRTVAIVRNEDGILVLKRSRGRSETPVFWELPTGKIKFGEQPEESMVRSLAEYTDLTAESLKLKDVITFLAPEGASQISNLYIVYEITIDEKARPVPYDRYSAYKFTKDFSSLRLAETTAAVLEIENSKAPIGRVSARGAANGVIINVDGASRGNPGPSGIGYCIQDGHQIVERGGEFIGFATSRVAEYLAMRKGIERALELNYKTVRFVSDSLMVINQLNGIFSIKNQDILPIYHDIEQKINQFDAVSFTHVPRSENTIADSEANAAIDKILQK